MADLTWRILLIDDDEDDQILVRKMLRSIQCWSIQLVVVTTYLSGVEAIHRDSFDAILIDYDLGSKTGVDLIREALALGCKAPMIMVTGRGRQEMEQQAIQAGASDYLTKSELDPNLLEQAIRFSIERSQAEGGLYQAAE